jgi:hypothetical protein
MSVTAGDARHAHAHGLGVLPDRRQFFPYRVTVSLNGGLKGASDLQISVLHDRFYFHETVLV